MDVEDLEVYKKLFQLAVEVHELSLSFPRHELYELGSQLRRSSNACPALLAEGFGNKHTNIYTEAISRSQGELRETTHHIRFASKLNYLGSEACDVLGSRYRECSKMLFGLENALNSKKR